jgi:hypothetical protein
MLTQRQRGWSWMVVLAACCAVFGVAPDSHALTAAQCTYFAVGGKTSICHATTSTKNPYSRVKVSRADCVNIHTPHPGDYVEVNDPKCKGSGCLPAGAPAGGVPCCEGLTAVGGVCVQAPACRGGAFTVNVSSTVELCSRLACPTFLDETTWELTGASAAQLDSGGPYLSGSSFMSTTTTNDVPLTFSIHTHINAPDFRIECGGAVAASGSIPLPPFPFPFTTVSVSNICCDARTCDASVNCDDGNACTDDSCSNGVCFHTATDCDDGIDCTADFCDPSVGCQHVVGVCDDGQTCTTDRCDLTLGHCTFTDIICPGGISACLVDSCDNTICSGPSDQIVEECNPDPAQIPGCPADPSQVVSVTNNGLPLSCVPEATCVASDVDDGCGHTRTLTYDITCAAPGAETLHCQHTQHITWTADGEASGCCVP